MTGSTLRIAADVGELAGVRRFVRDQARRAGADPRAVPDIVQAVDESVTNAIVHGYGGADGTVEIEVVAQGRALVVRLRDQAPPFDPTRVPTPDTSAPLEVRRPGGMGVHLARQMADGVTYRRVNGTNELTLVKECIELGGGGC
jgi:anti-sigma regulatory factor (Ser/Thr protein kinase)